MTEQKLSAVETSGTPGDSKGIRANLLSGFLVSLIAMPLCLAIARASNFPPIAGIWTAVLGGIVTSLLSNSELTIKGPAAGLIVIVAGAVIDLGREAVPELPPTQLAALQEEGATAEKLTAALENEQLKTGYRLALGVGVVAGLCQIGFGLAKAGKLGDFFPLTAVHGMLASIGIIIMSKQLYVVLGIDPPKNAGPLALLGALPGKLGELNPEISFIGIVSLLLLFGLPLLKVPLLRKLPSQLIVLAIAIPLAGWFDLDHEHTYLFKPGFWTSADAEYRVGPRFLVDMPNVLANPASAFFVPDFSAISSPTGWKYIAMFAIIASLESLLSAKAIELIDPWRRKTDFNRDTLACGIANTICASIGALPMISEIVRSKANVDNGATNRSSNFFHGLYLLAFVLLLPGLIHRIPLAALGAMLVYTGFRLAHPREFIRTWAIGPEQLLIFVVTIIATLATDLLIGIAAGILLKLLIHAWHGRSLKDLVSNNVEVVDLPDGRTLAKVKGSAVFSNWLGLQSRILGPSAERDLIIDLSETSLVDHSTMERLHQLEQEFAAQSRHLEIRGLENHRSFSSHPLASRRRAAAAGPGQPGA